MKRFRFLYKVILVLAIVGAAHSFATPSLGESDRVWGEVLIENPNEFDVYIYVRGRDKFGRQIWNRITTIGPNQRLQIPKVPSNTRLGAMSSDKKYSWPPQTVNYLKGRLPRYRYRLDIKSVSKFPKTKSN